MDNSFILDINAKLLFLDVDGVCNYGAHRDWAGGNSVNLNCIYALCSIINATDAKIVVSSDWRIPNLLSFKENFKKCIEQCGAGDYIANRIVDAVISSTLDFDFLNRGGEIKEWLDSNKYTGNFAIVDDREILFTGYPTDNLFLTSDKTGLTPEIADRIIKHLNGVL